MAKLWDDAELASYAASYPTNNQINNAAQSAQKKRGGLVDTLKSSLGSLATGAKDLGTSLVSMFGGAGTNNGLTILADKVINNKSWQQATNDAKKRQDDFTKWLYDTKSTNDAYAKNLGTALNGAQAALDFAPGIGQLAPVNALQGAMSGAAEQLKANGENADVNQLKNDAIVGATTGAVAGKFGNALGKLGANSAKGIGRTLATQVGKGAATGAVAGATGGGLSTVLNGGTLGEALANAGYGAKQGALAGGTMAGAMGLGGAALQKRAGKGQTVMPDVEEAVTVNKKRIAPTVEAEEIVTATPTRKGIAITDYNAGEETIPVNIKKNQQGGRGQYIDGIVKGKNLPEAEIDYNKRFANEYDAPYNDKYTLADYIGKGNMGEDSDIFNLLEPAVGKENIQKLKDAAYEGAEFNNAMAGGQYGMYDNKSELPALNRQEAYKLFGKEVAEELPSYMLSNNGRRFDDTAWAETFPQFTGGTGNGSTSITADDILELYKNAANSDRRRIYTTENIGMGLAADPELATTITKQLVDFYSPSKKIDIAKTLSSAQDVPITSRSIAEPQYTKSTIAARQYDTPTVKAAQNVAEMPEAAISTPEKATGWSNKDMTNSVKARNKLQVVGDALQNVGQKTKDNEVLSKLKGNTGELIAERNSVERLRELGFKSTDYDKAANMSEVINKYLADAAEAQKKPVEAPQLRDIAKQIAQDKNLSAENAQKLEKYVGELLDNAVTKDGKYGQYSLDRYLPADLEKAAKNLGMAAENITSTNQGGKKIWNRNLRPESEELAMAYSEARNRLRNEIGEMVDVDTDALAKRLKDAGATDKQIEYAKADGTYRGIKRNTSLLEDARTMKRQIDADKFKRGANSTSSTNIVTQAANASGVSDLIGIGVRPVAQAVGSAEKLIGKGISKIGDKLAGVNTEGTGVAAGKLANGASKVADALSNDYLYNMRLNGDIDFRSLGDIVTRNTNQGIAQEQNARTQQQAQEALANAQAEQEAAQNLANEQYVAQRNAEAQALGGGGFGMAQPQSQLDRISTAMELALNAGDVNAYNQLADLYTQAYKIEQMRNPQATAKEAKALSANQSKALTGLQQLDALEQMKPGARTALANSPLGGLVDLTGGDTYDSQAESLALTIGFLLSGANVKESEAKKIAKSYIPTVYDSDTVRQQKLSRARELLNSYVSDTTALQQ